MGAFLPCTYMEKTMNLWTCAITYSTNILVTQLEIPSVWTETWSCFLDSARQRTAKRSFAQIVSPSSQPDYSNNRSFVQPEMHKVSASSLWSKSRPSALPRGGNCAKPFLRMTTRLSWGSSTWQSFTSIILHARSLSYWTCKHWYQESCLFFYSLQCQWFWNVNFCKHLRLESKSAFPFVHFMTSCSCPNYWTLLHDFTICLPMKSFKPWQMTEKSNLDWGA